MPSRQLSMDGSLIRIARQPRTCNDNAGYGYISLNHFSWIAFDIFIPLYCTWLGEHGAAETNY
jgi:hypothetical protein